MSSRRLFYSFAVVCIGLVIAAPAFGAKGGNGNGANGNGAKSDSSTTSSSTSTSTSSTSTSNTSTSTSTSNSPSSPTASGTITLDGTAAYGQTASFTATDPPVKYTVEASVACDQNGQTVFAQAQDMVGSSPYHPQFMLWSPTWAANGGGSASCTAQLYYFTWKGQRITGFVVMASTNFVASG